MADAEDTEERDFVVLGADGADEAVQCQADGEEAGGFDGVHRWERLHAFKEDVLDRGGSGEVIVAGFEAEGDERDGEGVKDADMR